MARARSVALVALLACKHHDADPIPHAAAIHLDGEWDEPEWPHALRAQMRTPDGALARPSSEMRLLRDDDNLYVGLYAADEDIRSTDAFDVTVGTLAIRVDAAGHITPPAIHGAVDRDGTLDDAHDNDEEWVVELAIPLGSISPLASVHARRCDTPKDGILRCGEAELSLSR